MTGLKLEKNLFNFLFHFMRKQKFGFILLAVACLANALSISIWPKITEEIIDTLQVNYTSKNNIFTESSTVFLTAIGFWLLIEVMTRVQGITMAVVMPRFEGNLKSYLYSRVTRNSYEFYMQSHLGNISNKIGDLPRAAFYSLDIILTVFIPFIVSLLISSAFFLDLSPQIAATLVCWLVLHIVLSALFCKYSAHLSMLHARAKSDTQGGIVDALSNILPVKLFSSTERELARVQKLQEYEIRKNRNTMYSIELMKTLLGILGFIAIVALFWQSITLWQKGKITIGSVVLVLTSTLNLWSLVRIATEEIAYLIRELGVCKQSLDLLKWEVESENEAEMDNLHVTNGEITFDQVNFNYKHNAKHQIFANQSVTLKGGEKVGLVGFSGSGKTTFVKLIMRLFDINSGKILIDKQNIAACNLKSVRDNITFIPQEPYIFNRSIKENIAYHNPESTDEEIINAAKKAECHQYIANLENGYDTVVGERGALLSGGQRQRLMIARAILQNSKIIIMDEATSALDPFTERQVEQGMQYISNNKTTIVIAHKLATLVDMDRILVFHNGQIIADGSHTELLKNSEHYKMLWHMQNKGYLPENNIL